MGKLKRELKALMHTRDRLEASFAECRRLYDFAPVGYLTIDPLGVIREANIIGRGLLSAPGRSQSLWGSKAVSLLAASDRRKFLDHLRLCRERNDCVSTELRLNRKPGEPVVWLELISLVSWREGGKRREYHCALLDITGRKQAERARQESEIRFRKLADSVPALIWICDEDKRCVYFNRRWLEFSGRSREEQMAGGWLERIHPEDRQRCRKVRAVFFDARVEFKIEYRRRRFDGEYHWVLDNAVPLFGPANEFRGYIGSCIDITHHKRMEEALGEAHNKMEHRVRLRTRELTQANTALLAEINEHRQTEQALRESEERLADFFERSPQSLLWVGPDERVRRVNQAWIELAGRARQHCLQHRLPEFFADPADAARLLGNLKRNEVIHNHRARIRRGDGAVRHCLMDVDGLWKNGRLVHSRWFIRDITRQVQLEQEILLVTEREQRRIGRDLHDDLCQQLTGIEFFSQSLARRLAARSATDAIRARKIAGMIQKAITH
ncbi:MAG TPA: PAS domain S-box protein, partial [Verrucomicrobiae bacterium]|nr:PAS domain S-box protein [Verrucomicrobiae bacterium]